jgi:hypothetical protein
MDLVSAPMKWCLAALLVVTIGCQRDEYLPPPADAAAVSTIDGPVVTPAADAGPDLEGPDVGASLPDAATPPDAPAQPQPDVAPPSPEAPSQPDAAPALPDAPGLLPDVAAGRDALANGAQLSPAELGSPLGIWLDAAFNVSTTADNRVESWVDLSGNKHRATPQSSRAPTLVLAAAAGRPAIHFEVTSGPVSRLVVPDHESLRFGIDDFTFCAVARYRNNGFQAEIPNDYGLIMAKQATEGPPYPGPGLWGNNPWVTPEATQIFFQTVGLAQQVVASPGNAYNNQRIHVIIAMRVGTRLRLRVDGFEAGRDVPEIIDVSARNFPLVIGANGVGEGQQLAGDVFELFAMKGSLGTDQLHALERHFGYKYDLKALQ